MLKKLLLVLVALSIIFVMGCNKDDNGNDPEKINEFNLLAEAGDAYFTNYVTPGGNPVNVSIAAVFPILNDGDDSNDPFILDLREAPDYASGHIKNAVNISYKDVMNKIADGTIPTDKAILNVCYSGQTASWVTAAMNLMGMEAQNLLFGMCGVVADDNVVNKTSNWVKQIAADEFAESLVSDVTEATTDFDFPTLSTNGADLEAIVKARFNAESAEGWGKVAAADVFANPDDFFIINYWPQAEYEAPGHIPGAICFPPKSSLQKEEMLSKLPTDKTIVTYCYTGQTSAQVTCYLQMLGYDAKSLLYGVNGFGYNALAGHKYTAPTTDYSAIIVK